MKRILAVSMAFAIAVSLSACGNMQTPDDSGTVQEVSVLIPGRIDYPLWNYVKQESGLKIALQSVPADDMQKRLLTLSSVPKQMPDLVYFSNKYEAEQLARQDLLVKLSDQMEKLPLYERYLSVHDNEREIESICKGQDGELYLAPAFNTQRVNAQYTWIYRADVFQKAGLTVPTTMQELAKVGVHLKKLYPKSYPVALPQGMQTLNLLAPAWKKDAAILAYYDFDAEKWAYGVEEPWMGNFVSYWASMMKSGILPKDYLTRNNKGWEQLIGENRCFIMPEHIWKSEQLKKKYPYQDWRIMPAPRAAVKSGQNKIANCDFVTAGYAVCNSGDEKRIQEALRLLDWFYSDQAEKLLSWGKENESYHTDGADKKLNLKLNENASDQYGIGTAGLSQRLDFHVLPYLIPKQRIDQSEIASSYIEEHRNPAQWLVLTEKEPNITLEYEQKRLQLVMETVLPKFLTGARPMSEWQAFAENLENFEIKRVLDTYKKAYNRAK